MGDKYLVGVDAGGTAVKAAVYDARGNELAVSGGATELVCPSPGHTERDMEEFWRVTAACINDAIVKSGIDPSKIAGAACAGHGKGLYPWGRNGPVMNGIISTDARGRAYAEGWRADGTAAAVFKKTFQSILVSQPCVLLRWLKDNRRDVYDGIWRVFEAKDYLRFRLTGKAMGEITDFSGTNLVNLNTRAYDRELLGLYGIPEIEERLPALAGSLEECGRVTAEASLATGLPEGIPVSGGMFDIDACAIAAGIVNEDNICVIAGTWSINEYISKTPVSDGSVSMNSIYCLPGYYLIEESSPTSAGNLEWLAKNILSAERDKAAAAGKSVYKVFDEIVEKTKPEECGVLYLPYIYGSQDDPADTGCFTGFTVRDNTAQMIRSVYEGVVFNHRRHIDRLMGAKKAAKAMRLAGGGARSAVWTQMFADVCGMPVETVVANELGTLGCAIAASVTCGIYKDINAAVGEMVRMGKRYEPEDTGAYAAKYERFLETVKRMKADNPG